MTDRPGKMPPAGKRRAEFQRNMDLEGFLFGLNDSLLPSEELLLEGFSKPTRPILLLVGPMRAGTTLMMQWLAQTGLVAYPSNLMSRFFKAPIVGAQIQQLLSDPRYQFRDEFCDFAPRMEFRSQNGKTAGVLAPNEFWYFWHQFINSEKTDCWTSDELDAAMDGDRLLRELHGLTETFSMPFAAKGMKFNYALPYLHTLSDQFIFMHIHRSAADNMVSTLSARQRQFGNTGDWYSFKVPEYQTLRTLTPQEQVAGQIHSLNRAVKAGFKALPATNRIDCMYEDFCADPAAFYTRLTDKLGLSGKDCPAYDGPTSFDIPPFDAQYGSREELQSVYDDIAARMDADILAHRHHGS